MKKRLLYSILIIISFQGLAQDEKYQALFLYKFIQNLEFPEGKIVDDYKVGITGNNELRDQLITLTEGRKINGRGISITEYTPGDPISEFCILFLSNQDNDLVEALKEEALTNSVVLVGETPGLAKKGASLNFSRAQGRLGFEMNATRLESSNVKSSSSLKMMATQVD
ncbi:MAG: YfiR family protein [Cyclobacteriaceae bacterium]